MAFYKDLVDPDCTKSWHVYYIQLISVGFLGLFFLLWFLGGTPEIGGKGGPGLACRLFGMMSLVFSGGLLIGTTVVSFMKHRGGVNKSHKLMSIMTLVLFVIWLHFAWHGTLLVDNAHRDEADLVDARGLLPTEAVASLGALYGSHTLYTLSNWICSPEKSGNTDETLSVAGYLKFLFVMPLVAISSPFYYGGMRPLVNWIHGFKEAKEDEDLASGDASDSDRSNGGNALRRRLQCVGSPTMQRLTHLCDRE